MSENNRNKIEIVSMSNDWYELTDLNHFWIQWRFNALNRLLDIYITNDTKILEIGCGNGLIMLQIEQSFGKKIDGCDINEYALKNALGFKGNAFLYDIYDLKKEMIGSYDIILLLDVIEHIEDDQEFLSVALKYLKEGGIILVGVPALQFLFSKYDRVDGHKRRYSKKDLLRLYNFSGIKPIKISYWGFTLIPLLMIRKFCLLFYKDEDVITKGFRPPNNLFNKFLVFVMNLETFISKNPIIGTSIISLGKKQNED